MALQDIKSKFYNVALTMALLAPGGVAAAQDTNSIPTMTAAQAKALSKQPENCNKLEATFRPVVWYNSSKVSDNSAKMLVSLEKEEEGVELIPVKGSQGAAQAYLCGYKAKSPPKHATQGPVFEAASEGAGALTTMASYYMNKKDPRTQKYVSLTRYKGGMNTVKEYYPKFPMSAFEKLLPESLAFNNN